MKTQEEIKKLAESIYGNGVKDYNKEGFISGYIHCQNDLSNWNVTLNDGLDNEPYISDDFQIGPDGAYEHTEDMTLNKDYQPDYSVTNLDVITYRNGDVIPEVKDSNEWSKLTTGAYCYYDNDPSKGILYNWYAVNDPRGLAPLGWKIPNDEEIDLLDLKTTSQFNGYRDYYGAFSDIGANGSWWSSSENNTDFAWYRNLGNNNGNVGRNLFSKQSGFSVRCLRDDSLFKNKKNMTPRGKAKELVNKFSNECLLTPDGGKVAALIAVDEIKKILYDQDFMIRYDYWFEVKKEIEKL